MQAGRDVNEKRPRIWTPCSGKLCPNFKITTTPTDIGLAASAAYARARYRWGKDARYDAHVQRRPPRSGRPGPPAPPVARAIPSPGREPATPPHGCSPARGKT
jgi:hypothetical protein